MFVEVRGKGTLEDVNKALKIFSKMVKKEGLLNEIYARQEFVKPSRKRQDKRSAARQRKIRDELKLKRSVSP